ncbi:hypothetical protein D9M70_593520 [compost metagenome]
MEGGRRLAQIEAVLRRGGIPRFGKRLAQGVQHDRRAGLGPADGAVVVHQVLRQHATSAALDHRPQLQVEGIQAQGCGYPQARPGLRLDHVQEPLLLVLEQHGCDVLPPLAGQHRQFHSALQPG